MRIAEMAGIDTGQMGEEVEKETSTQVDRYTYLLVYLSTSSLPPKISGDLAP